MNANARSAAATRHRRIGPLVTLSLGMVVGCGVDGQTPSCGESPPLYDIQSEQGRALALEALARSAGPPYYCTTLPAGFNPGAGGAAGALSTEGNAGTTAETTGGADGDSEMTGAGAAAE